MAKLNLILPFFPTKPVGGPKNMYEFANRLAAKGHEVVLIHSIKRPFKKQKTPVWLRLIVTRWRARRVKWFSISPAVKIMIVPEIADKHIPDGDAILCTWWQMAYAIANLSPAKGKKCNLIQDYELWTGQDDKVHASYGLPIHHIVIAHYLKELVSMYNTRVPDLVNTPIDTEKFFVTRSIADRNPASVIMMYSQEPRKGTVYGIEALVSLRERVRDLSVTLFSVYDRPADLPDWIQFHKRPADLPALYNQHAIFTSPSLGEGWGLPPAESMACGCAVVCTDIGGHRDYATEGETALLAETKNPAQLAGRIEELILDSRRRIELARRSELNIRTKFNWDRAVGDLEAILLARG